MQYVECAEVVEQHIEPCDAQNFRRCIVYCFITGDFTLAELESSVAVIAASTGTAPLASAYFRHYDMRVEVRSGGISLAGNAEVLPGVAPYDEFVFGCEVFECTHTRMRQRS